MYWCGCDIGTTAENDHLNVRILVSNYKRRLYTGLSNDVPTVNSHLRYPDFK